MPRQPRQKYTHRRNNDETYDSICAGCFLTVARGLRAEEDLVCFEAQHDCPISFLAERGVLRDRLKENDDDSLAEAS
jgi:hypothetical protein